MEPTFASHNVEMYLGDNSATLDHLADKSVHCIITSPPYFNLRDYGVAGQVGLESTPEEYIARLVAIFEKCRRVLRDDGTLWLNLGDSYAANNMAGDKTFGNPEFNEDRPSRKATKKPATTIPPGIKPKDLIGIPWMAAFALRAAGWYLRSEIIWAKANPMPESADDRVTRAHEQIFMLSKSREYYFDYKAIQEPSTESSIARTKQPNFANQKGGPKDYRNGINPDRSQRQVIENWAKNPENRRKRSVWHIASQPYADAHFATFPPKLIEPCVLAGCPADGVILDPFMGSATVGMVALKHGRRFIGLELNPDYLQMAIRRIERTQPMLLGAYEDEE